MNSTIPVEFTGSCSSVEGCRTLQSIIFTCCSTIYLCAWVSLHVDIPNPRLPSLLSPFGRIVTFIVMVILPESWAHIAFQQMLDARKWAKNQEMKDTAREWTIYHGWLAVMGGFSLRTGSAPNHFTRLTSDQLRALLADNKIRLPDVSADAIQDRSKATGLAKFIVLFQTWWFIITLIARRILDYPIIPIEVFTLAFTLVTFALYACNWYKPYNMRVPVTVEVILKSKGREPSDATLLEKAADEDEQSNAEEDIEATYARAKELLKQDKYKVHHRELPMLFRQWPFSPLVRFCYGFIDFSGLFSPRYIYYHTHSTTKARLGSMLLLIVVGTFFGAIHFAAWNLEFPTVGCMYLWRVCTVAATLIPLLGLISVLRWGGHNRSLFVRALYDGFLVGVYAMCRFLLLVCTIWSLFKTPPGAYKAVVWTTYVPHI